MPGAFDITCRNCGSIFYETSGYLAFQQDDGLLVPLRHPGESRDLTKFNLTMDQAMRRAMIVRCDRKPCDTCGCIREERRFAPPYFGLACSVAFATLLAVPLAVHIWRDITGISIWIAAPVGLLACPLVGIIAAKIERAIFNYHRRNRPPLHDCPCSCQPTACKLVDWSDGPDFFLNCPHCHNRAAQITVFGIS